MVPRQAPPDVVLLAADWQPRALIRAQLLEEGFEVVATDTWPTMRRHLRPGEKPRLAIVDLKDLPEPLEVLQGLRLLMRPERVLVLVALGTLAQADVERLGFRALPRPFAIGDVIGAASAILGERSTHGGTRE
jgi:hypothetical protein